jgi:hypothetical protein
MLGFRKMSKRSHPGSGKNHPDPGDKKAPNPGSATLDTSSEEHILSCAVFLLFP